MPFTLPKLSGQELSALLQKSCCGIIADVLEMFFSTSLQESDVEGVIGKKPIRSVKFSNRLSMTELWHNPGGDSAYLVQKLSDLLRTVGKGEKPTNWVNVAVQVALLFASYANLAATGFLRGSCPVDVAVTVGDFSVPAACWYAKQMGLPIGKLVLGCNANGGVWDFLNRGEFPTGDAVIHTTTPNADFVVPRDLERLIHGAFGVVENSKYLLCCRRGRVYLPPEEQLQDVTESMFAAVTSDARMKAIVSGIYRNRGYVMSPYSALAYGSLQDYRAMTGETSPVMLLAERSPLQDGALVSSLLRIQEQELHKKLGI